MTESYCMKCRVKREMVQAVPEYNAAGAPVTRGVCGVCGTKMVRFGATPAHDGLPKPEPAARPAGKKAPKSKTLRAGKAPKAAKVSDAPVRRGGKLVIVESPAKARTVGRYLGKGYTVRASVGHVRDLLSSVLSVDVEHDFTPKYRVPNEKREVVKELKGLAAKAGEVYLATDPDREGEAIAWHLQEATELDPARTKRVVFHEITEPAIAEAFAQPRELDMDLVDAQQARRILDRLVGYPLTELLWEKVQSRLSAGRVQSVALRMVVEREREIEAFNPVEYWSIDALLQPEGSRATFTARLVKVDDEDPQLGKEEQVLPLIADLETAAYTISSLRQFEKKRNPQAPFITSTLQQEASRRLGYTARRSMALAQQLYEGIDVGDGGGTTGLITYMRTDSTNVSALALNQVRSWIQQRYGANYLPAQANTYRTRAVSAQEAHEAIRPTDVTRTPESVRERLTADQFKMYQLIWKRFVASQMESAVYDAVTVEVEGRGRKHAHLLRANGSVLKFKGFLEVYEEAREEDNGSDEEGNGAKIPPGLRQGQKQHLVKLTPEQHFTQPPPRYTESSLVQALEEEGIGRPSTYASIVGTIQDRGYVQRQARRLVPTETGFKVNDLLVAHFTEIVDRKFTARMESDLDEVANGETPWVDVVRRFYTTFEPQLEKARKEMPEIKTEPEKVGRACPQCGADLVIRRGRFGRFISCSTFPKCRYTEPILEKIGVSCPLDGGDIIERRSRNGRIFYGCANYPKCEFTSWQRPINTPCPHCGGLLTTTGRDKARCTKCGQVVNVDLTETNEGR